MVERVPPNMHVEAVVDGLGQELLDCAPQPRMVVGDDELDADEPADLESQEEALPA